MSFFLSLLPLSPSTLFCGVVTARHGYCGIAEVGVRQASWRWWSKKCRLVTGAARNSLRTALSVAWRRWISWRQRCDGRPPIARLTSDFYAASWLISLASERTVHVACVDSETEFQKTNKIQSWSLDRKLLKVWKCSKCIFRARRCGMSFFRLTVDYQWNKIRREIPDFVFS